MKPNAPVELSPLAMRWLFGAGLGLAALLGLYEIRTFDTFFHLATGRLIWEQGEVPTTDPFSFTFRGAPWENHSWGYQVGLAAVQALGGFGALSLLQAALSCATCALSLASVRRMNRLFPWAIALSVLPHAAFREVLEARPHMLAFVCLAASLHVCLDGYRKQRPLYLLWLLPVYLVWAASHGSHLLIFVILGAAVLSALLEKQQQVAVWFASAFTVSLLVCIAISPLAFFQGGEHIASDFLETSVHEWAPVTTNVLLSTLQGRAFLFLMLLAAVGIVPLASDPKPLQHLSRGYFPGLLFAFFALLGFTSVRMLALTSLGAAPLFVPFAARTLARLSSRTRYVPALGLLALSAVLYTGRQDFKVGFGLMEARFPVRAVELMRTDPSLARVYNAYNFGGYLMWERTPKAGVFVDGRAITIYPPNFLESFERAYRDPALFEALARDYAIDSVLMPTRSAKTQTLLRYLHANGSYRLRYEDEVATLFQRVLVQVPEAQVPEAQVPAVR